MPPRYGYTFGGWATEPGATDGQYFGTADGDLSEPNKDRESREDILLYAVWEEAPWQWHTVTYDANAGDDDVTDMPEPARERFVVSDPDFSDHTLSGAKPRREHYDFLGWSTDENAAEAEYAAADAMQAEPLADGGTTTLYAVWRQHTRYTVAYSPNGGTGDTVNDIEMPYEEEWYVLDDEIATGFTGPRTNQAGQPDENGWRAVFVGWSLAQTGTVFTDRDTYEAAVGNGEILLAGAEHTMNAEDPALVDGTITYHAVWAATVNEGDRPVWEYFKVTYDLNGGTRDAGPIAERYVHKTEADFAVEGGAGIHRDFYNPETLEYWQDNLGNTLEAGGSEIPSYNPEGVDIVLTQTRRN